MDYKNFEQKIFQYADQIKDLLSPKIWENILLDCSKNEIFILWLLFQKKEVNMTTISEYIGVPLNTTTGIISRMEKRELVLRERSEQDKRIVTIKLGKNGSVQIQSLLKECMYYGEKILNEFTSEEIENVFKMVERFVVILRERPKEQNDKDKIRKIKIE